MFGSIYGFTDSVYSHVYDVDNGVDAWNVNVVDGVSNVTNKGSETAVKESGFVSAAGKDVSFLHDAGTLGESVVTTNARTSMLRYCTRMNTLSSSLQKLLTMETQKQAHSLLPDICLWTRKLWDVLSGL
ncbi:hypothetical protein L6452_15553 [Arctium lappa]|uniref:Uncharacterized protein n=1 Tax=Arctium lappa TaxID=4217 RepID=A0ACB9CP12_ARCLA|nr:hypothetical protein L6452_15553 [Arctium lappa]